MSVADNKALVLGYFSDISAGNFEGALRRLADDCGLWIGGAGHWPLGGTHSPESARQISQSAMQRFPDGITMEVVGITAEGERVAVEVRSRARRADGRIYANEYHMLFIVREEKIVRRCEYLDVLHANDLLCGPLQI
jgi:ketosteroid isomerase-like protein